MKINCIIVDDEPLSQEVIETYIKDIPQLELKAKCNNAFDAMDVLRKEEIQLIFLDINMPKLSGINMVKSLSNVPSVIFITAYPEYAVEGFEVEAVDYILKPFSFERFFKAVNKVIIKLESQFNEKKQSTSTKDFIVVKADKKLHKINFSDILYFKSIGDYVKIFTKDKVLLSSEKLKKFEDDLDGLGFIRIHKSYIIPVKSIQFIEGNQVQIDNERLPIGLTYKEKLIDMLKNRDI